jgi:mitochondrial fission protein ELM1
MTEPTYWFITTGEAGFRTQARGLALALSDHPRELIVGLRSPWNRLPVTWTPNPFALLDPERDRPTPPWPDVLITCGRRTAALSKAIRRASHGRTVTVHVQDPLAPAKDFDLVVAMAHDAITGPNVIKVTTALHDVTPDRLAQAADAWRTRLQPLGRPLAGVLLGGPTRGRAEGDEQALIQALTELRADGETRLAIVPSRRTPAAWIAAMQNAFAADPGVYVWDREGDNPYLGVLALADRLIVTSDSVSMISEALATTHRVDVFGAAQNARHGRFLQTLLDQGQAGRIDGPPWRAINPIQVDSTQLAAQAVRRILDARTGVSA